MGYVAWDGLTYEGTPPEGWYEASDGRWWPIGRGPVAHATPPPPPATAPPPPPPTAPPGTDGAPTGVAPHPTEPPKRSGCLLAALIVGLILAGLVGAGLVAAAFLAESDDDEASEFVIESESGETESADESESTSPLGSSDESRASGDADEIDDVRSCSWENDEVQIELVNNSSKTSNYAITTAYLDGDGNRVAEEVHFINSVRSDEEVRESLLAIEEPTEGCEVIDVERYAGPNNAEELAEVGNCELGPPDFVDDATATLTATNSSSKISDYLIEVAFLDDAGVRVGHGTAFINSVRPGESAPGDVTSFSDAAPITSCEVASVIRNETT